METKMIGVIKASVIGLAMAGCLSLGLWHGESVGQARATEKTFAEFSARAVIEYEIGYEAGARNALYARPVSEELEMVCLGLWIATQVP